jgi:hypothetical protein
MHLIGKINGQIIRFKKKILEQVEIINIHHVIIEAMNGIVNGYQIKHGMIKDEVRIRYKSELFKGRQKNLIHLFPLCLSLIIAALF